MNTGKYVFAQIAAYLDHNEFNRCVTAYDGNYKVQHFTCWHQFLCMMFGQLSNRESLSDLIICLQSHQGSFYHLGIGKGSSKANLAKANENRDYRIYESFAYSLIKEARTILKNEESSIKLRTPVYALDATVVDLCLSIFWWGKFRRNKAAVKINTLFDIKTNIPTFIQITSGGIHEINVLDSLAFETGGFYIMDKGFIDFERFYRINKDGVFFLTRAKSNFRYKRLYSAPVKKSENIRCDQTVILKNDLVSKKYPGKLRRIKYYDSETNTRLIFMTNNFDLKATEIAQLYKYRWKIELFFKWIKQHLKIKSFWGHSFNAVKTQIYIAIITYVLVAIIKHKQRIKQSQYEILQILGVSLLCKTQLNQLFDKPQIHNYNESTRNQLNIFEL